MENQLVGLVAIVVLGVFAQWLAWLLRMPSILFLLALGILMGPYGGFIHPEEMLGKSYLPIVSIFVGIILFEGGMSLKWRELRENNRAILQLISFGMIITWILSALGARWILGFSLSMAFLLGAILVVSGPTVVAPMLHHIRPQGKTGSILKWEGIVIDPLGVLLMVLVYEVLLVGGFQESLSLLTITIIKTLLVGSLFGLLGALILIIGMANYFIPDHLESPMAIMVVLGILGASNWFQAESGLFSVTLMGIILANQKLIPIQRILEFKENLRVLLLSMLFILLTSALSINSLYQIQWDGLFFLVFLIFLVRPLAVYLSTLGSDLTWKEKHFLAFLAPRGIVAASVASIFALELSHKGFSEAHLLAPYVFLVIFGTVTIYGLLSPPFARFLGLSHPNPQGILFIGAHSVVRELAEILKEEKIPLLVADTNPYYIHKARINGIPGYLGNVLWEEALEEMDLSGLGKVLAFTANDEVNTLACMHFRDIFGRANVYQLSPEKERNQGEFNPNLQGRILFQEGLSLEKIRELKNQGYIFKKTHITDQFTYQDFQDQHQNQAIPLFLLDTKGNLQVISKDEKPDFEGKVVIALTPPAAKGKNEHEKEQEQEKEKS
ncbi:MAG: hypothetical protein D6785_02305 [Planctomycetota bacterium]|nr:MAG: hypothetical protein D6785_02305 [Planctomycetota bacterium]